MDEEKTWTVVNWEAPDSVKGVQSFLGIANFHWQFIVGVRMSRILKFIYSC